MQHMIVSLMIVSCRESGEDSRGPRVMIVRGRVPVVMREHQIEMLPVNTNGNLVFVAMETRQEHRRRRNRSRLEGSRYIKAQAKPSRKPTEASDSNRQKLAHAMTSLGHP